MGSARVVLSASTKISTSCPAVPLNVKGVVAARRYRARSRSDRRTDRRRRLRIERFIPLKDDHAAAIELDPLCDIDVTALRKVVKAARVQRRGHVRKSRLVMAQDAEVPGTMRGVES